jgi:hypothetical protein
VVIGGWAVISHGYVRATRDIDLLVPDRPEVHRAVAAAMRAVDARHRGRDALVAISETIPDQGWQLTTALGDVDFLLEAVPPLDFETVERSSVAGSMRGVPFRFAGLASLVAFKRLANRPQDRADLAELEAINGPLPIVTVPGLDT